MSGGKVDCAIDQDGKREGEMTIATQYLVIDSQSLDIKDQPGDDQAAAASVAGQRLFRRDSRGRSAGDQERSRCATCSERWAGRTGAASFDSAATPTRGTFSRRRPRASLRFPAARSANCSSPGGPPIGELTPRGGRRIDRARGGPLLECGDSSPLSDQRRPFVEDGPRFPFAGKGKRQGTTALPSPQSSLVRKRR